MTAGNSSPLNDGASAVVLASAAAAEELGVEPLARVVASATHALDPQVMGIAPAFAIPKALARAGLKPEEIDVWEVHEAYAAVAVAILRELPQPARRLRGPRRAPEPQRRRGRDRPPVRLVRHPLRAHARDRAAPARGPLRRPRRLRRIGPGRRARAREPEGCIGGSTMIVMFSARRLSPARGTSSGGPGTRATTSRRASSAPTTREHPRRGRGHLVRPVRHDRRRLPALARRGGRRRRCKRIDRLSAFVEERRRSRASTRSSTLSTSVTSRSRSCRRPSGRRRATDPEGRRAERARHRRTPRPELADLPGVRLRGLAQLVAAGLGQDRVA